LRDTHLIFTMPNADTNSRALIEMVGGFVAGCSTAKAFTSLGQIRYLSCMHHVDGVVGNSSSGLIEAPSLGKGTLNIGDRQRGRLKADSVIDCAPERIAITTALGRLLSPEFQAMSRTVRNPYGDGGASEKIVRTLLTTSLEGVLKKRFYDLRQ
jgi:GDP/UDP-N,N'-diacetylbacillosamine 2-epimerase (hydrolysing)